MYQMCKKKFSLNTKTVLDIDSRRGELELEGLVFTER